MDRFARLRSQPTFEADPERTSAGYVVRSGARGLWHRRGFLPERGFGCRGPSYEHAKQRRRASGVAAARSIEEMGKRMRTCLRPMASAREGGEVVRDADTRAPRRGRAIGNRDGRDPGVLPSQGIACPVTRRAARVPLKPTVVHEIC